ncbi:hypothetical protein TREMEDRAFT_61339 [Tremella mesenterica DSM 1558]|uniref:uncharacterized protein n=1 Tax=Tremella mesenterica (strain ATCC 24925 / CBS 8224 / DSM 1558 / NBRC 9311 / NRRL Y-6157 / RJB 2259-6 / UBC 559-6) TaxID=578456 RepID=UPI0003F48EF9|nr:uncharacterized protein TREMEDRAFT_61339 [Tremella mesenterica DSM 1558]EIW70833.1 hypothetical protein TREMEDRAFT_61339 [Tremella mesenterica DSM 1558]
MTPPITSSSRPTFATSRAHALPLFFSQLKGGTISMTYQYVADGITAWIRYENGGYVKSLPVPSQGDLDGFVRDWSPDSTYERSSLKVLSDRTGGSAAPTLSLGSGDESLHPRDSDMCWQCVHVHQWINGVRLEKPTLVLLELGGESERTIVAYFEGTDEAGRPVSVLLPTVETLAEWYKYNPPQHQSRKQLTLSGTPVVSTEAGFEKFQAELREAMNNLMIDKDPLTSDTISHQESSSSTAGNTGSKGLCLSLKYKVETPFHDET